MRQPYKMTLQELRLHCRLLSIIEVVGKDTKEEHLAGKNWLGEVVVKSKPGKITPAKVQQFKNDYQYAVAKGLIKAAPPTPIRGETDGEN